MDTLSTTSVTATLQVPGFPSTTTPREHHQFKPLPPNSQHLFHKSNSISKTNRPHISSFTSKSFINCSSPFGCSRLETSSVLKPPATRVEPAVVHRKASTGYAAALLDIAQRNNTLHVIERDVRRFLKLLRSPDLNRCCIGDEKAKGEVVKEIAVQGRFQKHLVVIVKLLVEKKKQVWMVNEVLEEFQRIYNELCGKSRLAGLGLV